MRRTFSHFGFVYAIGLAFASEAAKAGDPASVIYWTEGEHIKRSSIDQPAIEVLISGLIDPSGVDANVPCEEQLFWTDLGTEMIGRSNLDGSGIHQVVTLPNPLSIAAHPRSRTVYWSVGGAQDNIYRSNFDFSNAGLIVPLPQNIQLGNIRIAGDKLYWHFQECLSTCNRAVFQRCHLDGANLETLFVLDQKTVSDFVVDAANSRLFWTTSFPGNAGTVTQGNMDGSGIEVVINVTGIGNHLALDAINRRVFWTSSTPSGTTWQIHMGHLDPPLAPTLLLDGLVDQPSGLAVTDLDPELVDCNQNGVEDLCEVDCQPNGVPDSCDITSGVSTDCNSNGVPDECDLDCNANLTPDDCDIATGTSDDCDSDGIPDECELAGNDCNANEILDECDLAAQTSTDCDGNVFPDECELAGHDCNENGIHDTCDILNGTSLDEDENGFPDECLFTPPLISDPSGMAKSRFVSFSAPSGAPQVTALRVRMDSLHNVVPPYGSAPTVPFDLFEGQDVWVGPPGSYLESHASGVPYKAAKTQCTPHYRDWTTVGLLHVTGSHIVPSSIYHVQQVSEGCQGQEADCTLVSAPLEIRTRRWGDVETPFNPPSPSSQPDLSDCGALVNKFRGALGAPIKARALLNPNNAFGELTDATLNLDLSFAHIAAVVDAFRGARYPGQMGKCANSSAACTNHTDCGANGPCNLYCP